MKKITCEDILDIYKGTYNDYVDNNEVLTKIDTFNYYISLISKAKMIYENYIVDNKFVINNINNEEINFRFNKRELAHLLGVKTDYLKTNSLFKDCSSFECLELLVSYPNMILSEILTGNIDMDLMFSDYIESKSLSIINFPILTHKNLNCVEFIVKYDRHKIENTEYNYLFSEYLVGIKNKETNILSILGLVKNKNDKLILNSNIGVLEDENYEKNLYKLINNQEIICPKNIIAINYRDIHLTKKYKYNPTYKQLKQKVRTLDKYKDTYDTELYENALVKVLK